MPNQTGPNTPAGKKRSAQNARRHGILSEAVVLPELENPRDWAAHLQGIFESYEPDGHLEFLLAERIAVLFWKLRRLEYHQTAKSIRRPDIGLSTLVDDPARLKKFFQSGRIASVVDVEEDDGIKPLPGGWDLPTIIRYESHLHRQLLQTMHELEAVQMRRKGEHVNLARVDITRSPGFVSSNA